MSSFQHFISILYSALHLWEILSQCKKRTRTEYMSSSVKLFSIGIGLLSGTVFGIYLSQNYEVPKVLNIVKVFSQEAGKAIENIDKVEEIADKLKASDSDKPNK
ncbi:hypothetical protein LOD99_5093 [Oopsacas minuta]|uniref:Uncharacterized protein n=1 Tax=Oopsacas minuta TaxID=111878 RepID=A0AAV7JSZ4_9METZ|nr:hypothetical protein LOD99_5093 [Oopsacas minuta]